MDGITSVRFRKGKYVVAQGRQGVYSRDRSKICRGDEYQGVNSVFKIANTGLKWELQFHTKESLVCATCSSYS